MPGKACFDWLTVQGHWVRVGDLLLIKPAINISITICTYFRDGQTELEKAVFPIAKKLLFPPIENISEVESSNTGFI